MSTIYFPVSKIHLTDNYMKESSNNDCVVNVKNFGISDELGQNISDGRFIRTLNLQKKVQRELVRR